MQSQATGRSSKASVLGVLLNPASTRKDIGTPTYWGYLSMSAEGWYWPKVLFSGYGSVSGPTESPPYFRFRQIQRFDPSQQVFAE